MTDTKKATEAYSTLTADEMFALTKKLTDQIGDLFETAGAPVCVVAAVIHELCCGDLDLRAELIRAELYCQRNRQELRTIKHKGSA